jgi:Tfp pilus assembly protein PilF
MLRQEKHDEALALTHEAMISFGIDDGILAAALDIRAKIAAKTIRRPEKSSDTLSVCMIVRNEEAYLPQCLMSIAYLADEIIVVDTGSTDRTKDIALAFGAQVSEVPWTGDFSEARNASIEKAGCGWIFILDADEVISPRDHAALKKLIRTTTKRPAAYAVTTRNYITAMNISGWTANGGTYGAEEAGSGWNPSTKTRLFTNDQRIRFENRVHELVEPSLARIGVDPKPCDIPVHHYGKLKEDKVMTKGEDYFLLGREKLRETNDSKALYELALQAGELDRFHDAIELWEQFLSMQDLPQELVLKAYVNIGHAFVQTGRFEDAFAASKKAIKLAPGSASAVMNYGLSELWRGDPQRAVPFLEDLLKSTPDYPPAIGLLAVASLASGQADAAQRLFDRLKNQGFLCEPYLLNHANKLIAADRAERAITILEAAIASGLGSADSTRMLIDCRKRLANREDPVRPA